MRTPMKMYKLLTYLLYTEPDAFELAPQADGWSLHVYNMTELALSLEMQSTRVRRAFEELEQAGIVRNLVFGYNCVNCYLLGPVPVRNSGD